ncbi:NRDE family protein [Halorussus sp. MSC15.2]|uniref:NRDE family protein n=1 Tax=Halorussus sp. MSC15.2 TaxID=2283638 RepID=UPI0013D751F7|nr:NRDE family protein [Halorussus sp. MSC15.2]NEU56939.1 NRDE family protein [Halorussus sp. MSC15.2]
MCTLILAWQVFDATPVAAAANRDEALGRPSRPPGVLDRDPTVVAPSDEEAGGTWIGYNEAGVFVAVTNRRTDIDGERSRGLLVRDALARESASDAVSHVEAELAEREYAGFNLVVADADEAALLEWDGVLRTTHFDPGVHVVVNDGYDDAATKSARIREALRPDAAGTAERPDADVGVEAWFERAKEVLRDHDMEVCVHGDGYGTRSSSLVAVDSTGEGRYWFADGRPCETEYEVVTPRDEDGQF